MGEYIEVHIKREPAPVVIELDDSDPMAPPPSIVTGYYVSADGKRGGRCKIARDQIRKTRRVVAGETVGGKRVLVPV